uniref:DUS-like FMN-binding domain-containing protein n=1 Tax=Microcebus murinus TaxID=30608 RepID=A0A8C5XFZ3_MICMU
MRSDCIQTTVCQERKKDPIEMFHSGQLVKVCAPMVRYSKLAFRTLVRKYSCDLCYTPMIVAADFVRPIKARDSEFTTNQMINFIRCCSCSPYADGTDISRGCPQRWARAEGYGACLINKNEVENPRFLVSVKIRIHDDLPRTVDLCQKAEAIGAPCVTVRGRTAEERHRPVHYDAIEIIKENMSIPVIANGDIRSLKEAENVWQITGTDGVAAARGLLANLAMCAGCEGTPLKFQELGTPYVCFHQHLMKKRIFNALSSTSAVLDYFIDHYGI